MVVAAFIAIIIIQGCSDEPSSSSTVLTSDQKVEHATAVVPLAWYDLYLRIEEDLEDFRPNPTARAMGYISIAAYEAVLPGLTDYNSLETVLPNYEQGGVNPYNEVYWAGEVENTSYWELVLNHTYKEVFQHFLIGMSDEQLKDINQLYESFLVEQRAQLSDYAYRSAISHADEIATHVITYALSDPQGSTQVHEVEPQGYTAPVGLGLWRPTAPDFTTACHPYWDQVRLMVAQPGSVPLQPHATYSEDPESEFYKEAVEVNQVVENLTDEDRWIAEFWSDDFRGITFSPPGRQLAIANQLIELAGSDLRQAILIYLHLGLAINDASVICWGGKYEYNLERPVDYIRRVINPDFRPILGDAVGITGQNPNFPAYPSGHATFAAAGAEVFKRYFSDIGSFTDRCHAEETAFNGTPRVFTSFDDMASENAFSRIPLGVHFRMDGVEGLRIGTEVGRIVNGINLQRR